jgi:hypothetical protein
MYTPDDPTYLDWKAGVHVDPVERFRDWYDLIVAAVARGVEVRRARIISEPVTDFIRHEYEVTPDLNIRAGERVRWLPRRLASDLALVRFGYFAGDGTYLGHEMVDDPTVVQWREKGQRA